MYSSQNFLLPISSGDKTLKILFMNGQLAHIIRDATCTIRQDGINLLIKQQSESQTIVLDFATINESKAAHLLLRNALIQLNNSSNPPVPPRIEYNFNPTGSSSMGVAFNMTVPIIVNQFHDLYVNGLHIAKPYYSFQAFSSYIILTWKTNAQYIIDSTDQLTILYN